MLFRSCDVAELFVQFGVPFKTVTLCRNESSYRPRPIKGLGLWPAGYEPNALEYAAYNEKREDLIRSVRGRAALLRGGIVRRLALLTISPDYVFPGPLNF